MESGNPAEKGNNPHVNVEVQTIFLRADPDITFQLFSPFFFSTGAILLERKTCGKSIGTCSTIYSTGPASGPTNVVYLQNTPIPPPVQVQMLLGARRGKRDNATMISRRRIDGGSDAVQVCHFVSLCLVPVCAVLCLSMFRIGL